MKASQLSTKNVLPHGDVWERIFSRGDLNIVLWTMTQILRNPAQLRLCGYTRKGVSERLIVVKGWVIYDKDVAPSGYTPRLAEVGEMLSFEKNHPRFVLPGPSAELVSILDGVEVPNSELHGHDWWPASREYQLKFEVGDYAQVRETQRELRAIQDRACGIDPD